MNTNSFFIFFVGLILISSGVTVSFAQEWSDYNIHDPGVSAAQAIPDWVKSTMMFYLDEQISEREMLDAFNWLFENNIMHLSPEAAQEIQDLRVKIEEQETAISTLRTLVSSQAMTDESGEFWFEDLQPGYYENTDGERIMQPQYGADDKTQSKVIVRGWDPTTKEEIINEKNKESVQRFVIELYAKSLDSSQGTIWLPMVEGNVLAGYENGDPDRPIIIGRIYHPETTQAGNSSGEFWFEELTPGNSESTSGSQISPSQTKVLILASTSDFDFAEQTVKEILQKGGTVSAWEEGIIAFMANQNTESVSSDLQKIVVLCNNEIDKETQQIEVELDMIEKWLGIISEKQESVSSYDSSGRLASTTESKEQQNESDLEFISRKLTSIDQQIKALDRGVEVLEKKLSSVGDEAQVAKIELQNSLQKQQQTLQTLSNVSKDAHDTAMSVIRKIG
ncbi:MAG: hypothetical protein OES14_06690 [Nitrosopumilus sp.]|nr:hypothetical protein [Nitrosopumilus sp.]